VEGTNTRSGEGRRLVLGFDAGCMTCSGLAKRIEETVGGRLEIRNLTDPMMERWRGHALGEDAPWAPTLVEIEGSTVRAWTGAQMGVRLARRLGPAATWRVAKILGEMKKDGGPERSPYAGLSRSQFLKGVGGVVVGMSVLSGTRSFAAPAEAREHWLSQLSFVSTKELSEKEASAAWVRLARGRHLRGLLSSRALDDNVATSLIRSRLLSTGKTGVAGPSTATIKGVSHNVEGGGRLLALVYQDDDALIASYRFDKPGQETRLLSRVIEDESEELVRILAEAEDSEVFEIPQGARRQHESKLTSRGRTCRSGSNCGPCYACRCVSASKRCLFNCCAPCTLSCATLWTCLACVALWCPVCASINRCCYRKECRYISGC
jgi:hypothetical protein